MKIMDVPMKSVSDIKRSPMSIFEEAKTSENGVYIFNRNEVVGVALTREQYESIHKEIENLYDRIDELTVKERLANDNRQAISAKDVIGFDLNEEKIDENDGWE
ncbi:hypothetical protein WN59_10005 [Salinicoccus sediminis]|uniref:Antitoxin n=1 Tax=Salinicoccus sediminis TaxID=1432562 RepID=A0A0M2SJU4_9STAP|nr:hypothetical protein [Salinicoccus sediminis]KKK33931.1 hypothetical protein WN59_10005 [Salinicoccus sediminis]